MIWPASVLTTKRPKATKTWWVALRFSKHPELQAKQVNREMAELPETISKQPWAPPECHGEPQLSHSQRLGTSHTSKSRAEC